MPIRNALDIIAELTQLIRYSPKRSLIFNSVNRNSQFVELDCGLFVQPSG